MQRFEINIHKIINLKRMCYKLITTTLFLIFSASLVSLSAQDLNKKKREVGLQFSSINFDGVNTFGAFFKKQMKENVYRRISFNASVGGNYNENYNSFSFSGGVTVGREKRKALDDKLVFFQGPLVGVSMGIYTVDGEYGDGNISGSFQWAFGLQHSFNERWAINIETDPGVSLNIYKQRGLEERINAQANASNRVALGLVRKF